MHCFLILLCEGPWTVLCSCYACAICCGKLWRMHLDARIFLSFRTKCRLSGDFLNFRSDWAPCDFAQQFRLSFFFPLLHHRHWVSIMAKAKCQWDGAIPNTASPRRQDASQNIMPDQHHLVLLAACALQWTLMGTGGREEEDFHSNAQGECKPFTEHEFSHAFPLTEFLAHSICYQMPVMNASTGRWWTCWFVNRCGKCCRVQVRSAPTASFLFIIHACHAFMFVVCGMQ